MEREPRWALSIVFAGGAFLLTIGHLFGLTQPLEFWFVRGVVAIEKAAQRTLGTSQNPVAFLDTDQIIDASSRALIQSLEEENKKLREDLDFLRTRPEKTIAAYIVSQDTSTAGRVALLDRGVSHGVRQGDAVVSKGVLVGKITQVDEYTSQMQYIGDTRLSVSAVAEGKETTVGIVQGSTGGGIFFDMVPSEVSLEVGDRIVTRGLEKTIAARIPVGTVISIEKKPGDIFQKALLQIVPTTSIDYVVILQQ